MSNFVYLVGPADGPEAAVIDPAWDVDAIIAAAERDGRRLESVFLSHHHHDHMNGLGALLARLDLPVYVQRSEADFATPLRPFSQAVRPVGPGDVVQVGSMPVTCIHTPGHTPGSQCLLCAGSLVSGDTVFVDACGRCDLPGGDAGQMFDSLHRVLGALGDETRLYPGHDYGDVESSTLGRERQQNPYFKLRAVHDFVAYRLRPRG
jgi:glyoxylase-like metal-dependent hydrolase (beta-lactamase superfamily II)